MSLKITSAFVSLCCLLVTYSQANGQPIVSFCGVQATPVLEPQIKYSPLNYIKDGLTIAAHGELKVLMVLIEFKDETWEPRHPYWPTQPPSAGQPVEAPYWLDGSTGSGSLFLAPHEAIQTRQPFSVTDYMYEMSKTQPNPLRMHGKVVRVILPFTAEQASLNPNLTREYGIKWALEKIDQTLGLNGGLNMFDMWTSNGFGAHVAAPDNNLDLVICALRTTANYPQFATGLGARGWLELSQVPLPLAGGRLFLPNSGKWVGNAGGEGSSIFLNDWLEVAGDYAFPIGSRITGMKLGQFRVLIHELGHLLLTFDHYRGGPWSLLSNIDDRAYCPTAMQMCMLGWASPTVLGFNTPYDNDHSLGDLYTTGQCIAVEGDPSGNSSTYFFFENHQMLSDYDFTARPDYDPSRVSYRGVYILRSNGASEHHIESASGRYSWENVFNKFVGWGSTTYVPVLVPSSAYNPDGFSRSQIVNFSGLQVPGSSSSEPILYSRVAGQDVFVDWYGGSEAVDHYSPCGESADWGPTSRTPSHYPKWNISTTSNQRQESRASMRLKSIVAGVANLRMSNQNIDITPPMRISSFSIVSKESDGNDDNINLPVVVTTTINIPTPNVEPDLDGYVLAGHGTLYQLNGNNFTFDVTIPAGTYAVNFPLNICTQDVRGNRSCSSELPDIDFWVTRNFTQQSKSSVRKAVVSSKSVPIECSAFPNPVDDIVTISVPDEDVPVGGLSIFDLTGNVASVSCSSRNVDGMSLLVFSAKDLTAGPWFYRIRTSAHTVWGSFIKQ